jgi:chemotaxis protein MotB
MSLKRRARSHPNHERWLVSYADFITLLFAFFVVMYSASQLDKGKIGKLAVAIQLAFKDLGIFADPASRNPSIAAGPTRDTLPSIPASLDPGAMAGLAGLQKELTQAMAGEIKRGEVGVKMGREGLVVSLREVGFFDSGSAKVKLKSEPSIARIAQILKLRNCNIRIEGHTDNVPIHNAPFASNWELSTARATEMTKLFITRYDFPPERLSAAGFGEFHPVATNETEEGKALNRRVDIVVVAALLKAPSRSPGDEVGNPSLSDAFKEGVPEGRK